MDSSIDFTSPDSTHKIISIHNQLEPNTDNEA